MGDANINYRRFWRSCGYIYPVYKVWAWAGAQTQAQHCMDTHSAKAHWLGVPEVCDDGEGLAPLYMFNKRASAPRLPFLKEWPSHPAKGVQLAVKPEASSGVLQSWVKWYEQVWCRHQPSSSSSSSCRGDQSQAEKTLNLPGSTALPSPPHFLKSQLFFISPAFQKRNKIIAWIKPKVLLTCSYC